jgi:hypothetical protein
MFRNFLSLKNYLNVPSKCNEQKTYIGFLKVTDENSRIPSRIRTENPQHCQIHW